MKVTLSEEGELLAMKSGLGICDHEIEEFVYGCSLLEREGELNLVPLGTPDSEIFHGIIIRNCKIRGYKSNTVEHAPWRFCSTHDWEYKEKFTKVSQCRYCGKFLPTGIHKYTGPGWATQDLMEEQGMTTTKEPYDFYCSVCNKFSYSECRICGAPLKHHKGCRYPMDCKNKLCIVLKHYLTGPAYYGRIAGVFPSTEQLLASYLKTGVKKHMKQRKAKGRTKADMDIEISSKTGGDLRRVLLKAINETLRGNLPVSRANAIGRLAEQVIKSVHVDILHHKYVEDITNETQEASLDYTHQPLIEQE